MQPALQRAPACFHGGSWGAGGTLKPPVIRLRCSLGFGEESLGAGRPNSPIKREQALIGSLPLAWLKIPAALIASGQAAAGSCNLCRISHFSHPNDPG